MLAISVKTGALLYYFKSKVETWTNALVSRATLTGGRMRFLSNGSALCLAITQAVGVQIHCWQQAKIEQPLKFDANTCSTVFKSVCCWTQFFLCVS